MTVPYLSLDREFLAARLTALINWTLRVSESYDRVMSRVQRLEASQRQQEVQANHEHQLMRIIELFMQDDVRACTVMDYIIVFFRLLLAKLRQKGQDFDDVRQLNKALSDEEVGQIFKAVLSKLGFPANEQGAILVVLEAMQHRRWPKSQVMTTSPGGDAQISSALLYLRLQRDLEPVMSSALQRALCAAHECILTDLAISEATAQDVNINASDIRKDDAYVDARVKYEDYASFDRNLLKAKSGGGVVHEGVPESVEEVKDLEAAVVKSSEDESGRTKNRRILCERVASTSVCIEHTSSVESGCSVENSSSSVEEAGSGEQPQDAVLNCSSSECPDRKSPTTTASLPSSDRQTPCKDTTLLETVSSIPVTGPADTGSSQAGNDVEHPGIDEHQDVSHNACTEETDAELNATKICEGAIQKPELEKYRKNLLPGNDDTANDSGTTHNGKGLRDSQTPPLQPQQQQQQQHQAEENMNQSSAADEMDSPVTIDRSRLAPDPNFYVLCYDLPTTSPFPTPTTPTSTSTTPTLTEEWQKSGVQRVVERRHRPGCLAPRRVHGKSANVEDLKTG